MNLLKLNFYLLLSILQVVTRKERDSRKSANTWAWINIRVHPILDKNRNKKPLMLESKFLLKFIISLALENASQCEKLTHHRSAGAAENGKQNCQRYEKKHGLIVDTISLRRQPPYSCFHHLQLSFFRVVTQRADKLWLRLWAPIPLISMILRSWSKISSQQVQSFRFGLFPRKNVGHRQASSKLNSWGKNLKIQISRKLKEEQEKCVKHT